MYTGLDFSHLIAIPILLSYFSIILVSFGLIVYSNFEQCRNNHHKSNNNKLGLFVLLTLGSFLHTWYYMFQFMTWSFTDHGSLSTASLYIRITNWLSETSLFIQAWELACNTPSGWWWSQQICLYTIGGWATFLVVQGRRHKIKYLPLYMLLGQLVAISVASNLFYTALILSPRPPPSHTPKTIPKRIWISTIIGLFTILITPLTTTATSPFLFAVNLGVMHLVPFVPLLFSSSSSPSSKYSLPLSTWILTLAVTTFAIRLTAMWDLNLVFAWGRVNFQTLMNSNSASSSIGWDVEWTALSYLVWKWQWDTTDTSIWVWVRRVVIDIHSLGVGHFSYGLVQGMEGRMASRKEDVVRHGPTSE